MLSNKVSQARRGLLALSIALVLVLASVAPALGQGSTTTKSTDGQQTLPFTGIDPALLLVSGVGLLGVGVGLRRVVRPAA
jgi:hypothetical protein